MKLNIETYKDKMYACWIGKNIGGTMGTPYEGQRKMQDIRGFVTDKNVILPNDDLDLQLVWLNAVEKYGAKRVDAALLGEFWISFVTPHWNEYGIGKANMKMGLYPPLSGDAFNNWRDSNGAWIRTEIWACLAPGAPDIAAKYAFEDASVDHGAGGEGTVAAVFVAALESAAFFESDYRKLIEIGLSRISPETRVAKSVRLICECYDKGMNYRDARNVILEANADIGDGWFEAPSNVAYVVLGLLWGEGDFKKSMIYTINCGDDTDCTGATIGSIMAIAGGTKAIPKDWSEHIGDGISTISIALGVLHTVPKNCRELCERVLVQAPMMLRQNGAYVSLTDGESEIPENICEMTIKNNGAAMKLFKRPPYSFTLDFIYMSATVMLGGDPKIAPGEERKIKIKFKNNHKELFESYPHFLKLRWLLPDGFSVSGERCIRLPHENAHYDGEYEAEFVITAENTEPINRLVLEVVAEGRLTAAYIPVVLFG